MNHILLRKQAVIELRGKKDKVHDRGTFGNGSGCRFISNSTEGQS